MIVTRFPSVSVAKIKHSSTDIIRLKFGIYQWHKKWINRNLMIILPFSQRHSRLIREIIRGGYEIIFFLYIFLECRTISFLHLRRHRISQCSWKTMVWIFSSRITVIILGRIVKYVCRVIYTRLILVLVFEHPSICSGILYIVCWW